MAEGAFDRWAAGLDAPAAEPAAPKPRYAPAPTTPEAADARLSEVQSAEEEIRAWAESKRQKKSGGRQPAAAAPAPAAKEIGAFDKWASTVEPEQPAPAPAPKRPGPLDRLGAFLAEGRSQPDPSLSGITPDQARGMVGEPAAQPPPGAATGLDAVVPRGRRGGVRSEAQPFVAGFAERENAPPAPKTAGQMLETPGGPTLSAEQQLTQEREQGSKSPALLAREQADAERAAREVAPQEARPLEITNRITTGIRENVQNPALRGLIAGGAELGKVGTGAVRLAADVMGVDNVARFAQGAERRAGATSTGSTQDLKGNDKLVADIFSSIVNSAPSMALGVAGVGQKAALNTLFAQSTLQEYGAGRDAGFGVGESLSRATIMGYSEALGEKFGFGEQIKLLKSVTKNLPSNEVAKVFGAMLVKEIPGEQLTTAMQFLADKIGPAALRPNASITDYLEAAGETLKVTIGQTLLMGGGPALIAETKNQYRKADTAMGARPVSPVESFLTPPPQDKPLPPTQIRTESIRRFDEMAAQFGMNPKSVAAAKQAAADMPAGEVPGFLGRMAEALQKRGLVAKPIDEQGLAGLSEALDGKPEAPAAPTLPDEAINAPGLVDEQNDTGLDETLPRKIAGEPINREWTSFAPESGTLGIPRAQMPQIAAEHRGALVNFLNARGVAHEMAEVDPAELKPTQAEFQPKKVAGIAETPSTRSLLVSSDGHILDGHHQFLAALETGRPVRVVRLDAPIQDLLRLAHQFPSSTVAKGPSKTAGATNEQQPLVPDPAAGVSGAGPDGAGAAGVSGGTVRPVADDAQRGNADDPAATAASGRPGDDAGRGRGDDAALNAAAPVTTQPPAQAGATEAAAPRVIGKYGRTPKAAEEIELRPNADGTLTPHTGKYPMVDFESGNPITLPADVTDAQAAKAIRDAGAVTAKDKFYGVKEDAAPATAAPAAPAPQATPEELLSAAEKRVDGLKALLACLTS